MFRLLAVASVAVFVLLCRQARAEECQDIMPVWSGHPVGFCLLTHGSRQFVAFYDADRQMTLGVRTRDSSDWQFARLPEKLGWDSHNYVTMAIDRGGFLHVSGNMHGDPLVYFRSRKPFDIHSMERIPAMVGERESRLTYPVFMEGPGNELIFTYRDGGSGKGDQIYNVYDVSRKRWRRLLDTPLTSGEGKMNAYFHGPKRGPDGFYHLAWVWRDTGDCSTNHDLSYARSRDLVHWETSSGKPLKLPITLATADVIDPVPPGGGIINGNTIIGFDSRGRVVVSYHKYDDQGRTQLYNARLEDGGWKIYRTSDWDYRWAFSGGGSIGWHILFGPVTAKGRRLTQSWRHVKHGSGTWILDEATLRPTGLLSAPAAESLSGGSELPFEGAVKHSAPDSGRSGIPGVRYELRWQTLGANRDRPREGPLPPPSMLRICRTGPC